MQDEQEQKSQKQKKKKGLQRQVEFPVALSVIVAAFALFSVASFGLINRQTETVSYAAPSTGFNVVMYSPTDTEHEAGLAGIFEGYTTNQEFYVPYYYVNSASNANRIFCVEHGVDVINGTSYSEGDAVEDYGLMYILNHSYPAGVNILNAGDARAEVWATQAAIWLYQHKKHPGDTSHALHEHLTDGIDSVEALTKVTKLQVRGGSNSLAEIPVSGAYSKINSLVEAALAASSSGAVSPTVTLNRADQFTQQDKYYKTSAISVVGNPSDAFVSFNIANLKGVDGIKVVDEAGKDLALTNIPAGKKFFLLIPADKVTEKAITISYDVIGNFNVDSASYYVASGSQKLIDFNPNQKQARTGDSFNLVGSPDTGMNAAQTIYFIGLIVLLCGVGIVYANTKPVESKQ